MCVCVWGIKIIKSDSKDISFMQLKIHKNKLHFNIY